MNISNSILKITFQTAVILFAAIAIYSGSLSAPFVFDDFTLFGNADSLRAYGHGYFNFELRWLPYASLAKTTEWLGFDRTWLRLGNVVLHAANAIALLFLLRRLFRAVLTKESALGEEANRLAWLAFFGALLFALHPVAVYGVAYLIQRSTLMATLFVLLMLLAYLEGLLRGGLRWMLLAAAFYFAAVYSKEHSIMAPGIALALTLLIRKPSSGLLKQIAPFYMLAVLIAGAVLWSTISTKAVLGAAYEPNAGNMLEQGAKLRGLTELPNLQLLSVITQCGLFFKYLWLWLVPNPAWMSVDMREPFATSLLSSYLLGLLGFLSYFAMALWLLLKRGKMGLLGFALLFPWIMFLTEWSTVRIQEPFVLYRSYLWMPGIFAVLPLVFAGKPVGKFASGLGLKNFVLLSLICLLLIPLTLNRLDSFSSTLKLWDDAEKLVRGKVGIFGIERVYYNRGTEFGLLERYEDAISDFNMAIAVVPFDYVYGNRATAYYMLGKYREALRDYDRAIEINPKNANSYYGRSLTQRALGDFSSSQEDIRRSCELGLCP